MEEEKLTLTLSKKELTHVLTSLEHYLKFQDLVIISLTDVERIQEKTALYSDIAEVLKKLKSTEAEKQPTTDLELR